jgi:hypothetical protein
MAWGVQKGRRRPQRRARSVEAGFSSKKRSFKN